MGNRCVGWASGSNVAQHERCSGADGGLRANDRKMREKDNAEARRSLRNAEIAAGTCSRS
jgi:hypothetical protein